MGSVTMRFPATVEACCETGKDISQRLRELDGVEEMTGFAEYAEETEDFFFRIKRAAPTLRFDDKLGLVLELVITIDRNPTQEDRFLLYQYWQSQVEGCWGSNYEFDLPDGFEDFQVHFDDEPIEPVADPNASAMEALVARLTVSFSPFVTEQFLQVMLTPSLELSGFRTSDPVKDTTELAGMSDEQLAFLEKSLQWEGPMGDSPAYHTFNRMACAVETEILGRRVATAREKAGIEAVSLDNLDALDDLPDDVF